MLYVNRKLKYSILVGIILCRNSTYELIRITALSFFNSRVPCNVLFEEAIQSARNHYNNQHVYPYTYQGGYFYRNKMYKEAFESWANASDVIRL